MKPVIYQLAVRYFGNIRGTNTVDGDIRQNGCGRFADVNAAALASLAGLGVTHIWLTGVLRQATLTDYSALGLPADPPEIVKGRAGSFYAVRDYGDVCPDYAVDPTRRMAEFEALVERIHAAGLKVLMDLVPNHVSRNYASRTAEFDFGRDDDQGRFFDPANNFYYLADPPGRALELPRPGHWQPAGVAFTGRFAPEDGRPGHTPKATGGDDYGRILDTRPPETLWYETVKLNYGFDFVARRGHYDPPPRTWTMVDAILGFWQDKGIDGFRCDFAHYVPAEAWRYLIARARERRPGAWFAAEAYPYAGSPDPVHGQDELIAAGFDAVYHYTAYNALKGVYQGQGLDPYEREMNALTDTDRPHYMTYLENHDERRIPSPVVPGAGHGDSGFGSMAAGYQLAPLQFLYSQGPVLLFNGQEVGEPGAGAAGFKSDNGRTSIFDYWRMPSLARWVNEHRYDGGRLDPEERALRRFYGDLLALCRHPSVLGSGYWGLRYCNRAGSAPGTSNWLYAFARFAAGSGRLLVVVANFRPGLGEGGRIRLPRELLATAGVPSRGRLAVRLILDRSSAVDVPAGRLSVDALADDGLEVRVEEQSCHVYELGPG